MPQPMDQLVGYGLGDVALAQAIDPAGERTATLK